MLKARNAINCNVAASSFTRIQKCEGWKKEGEHFTIMIFISWWIVSGMKMFAVMLLN